MSTINVTNLKGRGGASPNLPDGAVITGVVTATSFSGSGANLTGLANTDFINSEQITVVGVVTAGIGSFTTGNIANVNFTKSAAGAGATVGSFTGVTTYYGDGTKLTGVGETIAPWNYNPDVNDLLVTKDTGIGVTFNKKILSGSGTATLKIVNAGVAGTTIQSWGVSSCTFNVTDVTFGSLVSDLTPKETYQFDIPSGFFKDSNDVDYVGTAWTFAISSSIGRLFVWGRNEFGELMTNDRTHYSSPIQIPGTNWSQIAGQQSADKNLTFAVKSDGTLWCAGRNNHGQLAQNSQSDNVYYSSPVQIGSDTTWQYDKQSAICCTEYSAAAIKKDGTLWMWGQGSNGQLGQNSNISRSSPVQIPGTTWKVVSGGDLGYSAIKTDGTMWSWGRNSDGQLGLNQTAATYYSSPVQIPGTTWNNISKENWQSMAATKTDGTLWVWGHGTEGMAGHNNQTIYSSPTQIPGTTWSTTTGSQSRTRFAIRTDGTLWGMGRNNEGHLGQNNRTSYSSPVQIPGTWSDISCTAPGSVQAIKTDGTLWRWGNADYGSSGRNNDGNTYLRSSPVQVGSANNWKYLAAGFGNFRAVTEGDST